MAWHDFGEVHQEIRGVTERIGSALLEDAENTVTEFDLSEELARLKPVTLPVGDNLNLPPTLFGGLANPEEPIIPSKRRERRQLVERYQEFIERGACTADFNQVSSQQWSYIRNSDRYPGQLLDILDYYHNHKTEINRDQWNQYLACAREQLRAGNYNLETFVDFRFESMKAVHSLSYNVPLYETVANDWRREMLYALSPDSFQITDLTPADYLVAPIGEYGKPFAEKMLGVMAHLQHRVVTAAELQTLIGTEAIEHTQALQLHTARTRLMDGNTRIGLPQTEREGIMSTIQAMILLTSERVDGYETGEELLTGIIDAGLVEQFTRAIPMGFMGPATNISRYCPGLVIANEHGKLILNPEKMAHFKKAKEGQLIDMAAKWATYRAKILKGHNMDPPEAFGIICPAAMPRGAISRTNQAVSLLLGLETKPISFSNPK